jgi:Fic family protein
MSKASKIKEISAAWIKSNVNKKIVERKDINNEQVLKYLLNNKILFKINRSFYLIKKQEENFEDIYNIIYWELVKKILRKYESYSIKNSSAIKIYLGNQNVFKSLKVRTAKNISHKIDIGFGNILDITKAEEFDENLIDKVKIAGIDFAIDKPELILLAKNEENDDYYTFLKAFDFDIRLMELFYEEKNRPVLYSRLVRDFQKVAKIEFAEKLNKIIKTKTVYRVTSPKIEFTGKKYEAKVDENYPPFVFRQIEQIKKYEIDINKKFSSKLLKVKSYDLNFLLASARECKKYDIYNSTTIEGYDISEKDVEDILAVLNNNKKNKDFNKQAEINLRNRMAIIGYHFAFDFLLAEVKRSHQKNIFSENFVKDIFFNLFKPSVDAKIISKYDLLKYRNIQVYIRNSNYIPPSSEKVNELMKYFPLMINRIENPIVKAILAHYLLVTIHPFVDGNGRSARLLMNYFLLCGGYKWVTIEATEQINYFKALQKAQVGDDIIGFSRIILKKI